MPNLLDGYTHAFPCNPFVFVIENLPAIDILKSVTGNITVSPFSTLSDTAKCGKKDNPYYPLPSLE